MLLSHIYSRRHYNSNAIYLHHSEMFVTMLRYIYLFPGSSVLDKLFQNKKKCLYTVTAEKKRKNIVENKR
jgi:hypothetical protein